MLVPLFVGVVVFYDNRVSLLGAAGAHGHKAKELEPALETPVTVVTVIALVILGWAIARDIGRSLGPPLFRRLDPATAGTVGFLIRLLTIVLALLVALRVAGIEARTLALGGAFTAVIFGLAAQQTLGNVIAGTVLLSARPFRVGDRVRLQGGPLAGQLEGTVSSLGLLYTTFAKGEDSIMVPNSVVLNSAVIPLREPEAVNLRARLRAGDDSQRHAGAAGEAAADAAARLAADHAGGARRRGGRRAHRRDPARGRGRPSAGQRAAGHRLARDALGRRGAHAVAQEQGRAALQHAQQLQLERLAKLRAGDDPQRLAGRVLAAGELRARATGTARRPARRAAAGRSGAGRPRTAACARQSARSARPSPRGGRAGRRGARARRSSCAGVSGRLDSDGVTITTRACGSFSSGVSGASDRRPETMQASGSSLRPRSTRRRLVDWRRG